MPQSGNNGVKASWERYIEYTSGLLRRYFLKYSEVQIKVHHAWQKHAQNGFVFQNSSSYDNHLDLMTIISNAYSTDLSCSNYIQLVWGVWTSPKIRESLDSAATLPAAQKRSLEVLGRVLSSLLILNGEYQKAILCLDDLVLLNPNDIIARLIVLKMAAQLGEWDVFASQWKYQKNLPAFPDDQNNIVKMLELLYKINSQATDANSEHISETTRPFIGAEVTRQAECEASVFAYEARIAASRLPYSDLSMMNDPIRNRGKQYELCHLIVKSWMKTFFDDAEQDSLLLKYRKREEFEKLMSGDESKLLLKKCAGLACYFDTRRSLISEYLETGQLSNAHNLAVASWRDALKLTIPIRLIRSIGSVLKICNYCSTMYKEQFAAARKCVEILLSDSAKINKELQGATPKRSSRITKAAESSCIRSHEQDCPCVLCKSMESSAIFTLEYHILKMIYASYNTDECKTFYDGWTRLIAPTFQKANKSFRSKFMNCRSDRLNNDQSAAYVGAIASWALTLLPEHVIRSKTQKLIKEALEIACANEVSLRAQCLLLKQLIRCHDRVQVVTQDKENVLDSVDTLGNCLTSMRIDASSAPARGRPRRSPRTANKPTELPADVIAAREEFLSFSHLLLREWRPRICSYLGQYSTDPYERAYYFSETSLCAIRHTIKSHFARSEESHHYSTVHEFREDLAKIPKDLTVVQLFVDHNSILWLLRTHSDLTPFTLAIADLKKCTILTRMETLMEDNNASEDTTKIADGKQFWTRRIGLDNVLKKLLIDVQEQWFGAVMPLLLPFTSELPETLVTQLAKTGMPKDMAQTLICAAAVSESKEKWLELVKRISSNAGLWTETVGSVASVCFDNLDSKQKADIKESVRERFTILQIPPEFNCISFELMPFMQKYPLICRIFSLKLFSNLISKVESVPKPVNGRKTYFVLNPGGDLPGTEDRVGVVVEGYKFDGIKSKIPESTHISAVLKKYDIFLYAGHGSGGRYFGRTMIRSSTCNAVSILMGCHSSAIRMEAPGFDGRSAVYDYLIARCPCLVGCLWMVTDGEIDKYLCALLEYCFSHLKVQTLDGMAQKIQTKKGYRTLLRGIAESREKCRLKYLTGGAVVAYGLPVVSQIV